MTVGPEEISKVIRSMDEESNAIELQIIDICYWMQGGVTWDEAWSLGFSSRQRIVQSVNEKIRKQSGDTREYM